MNEKENCLNCKHIKELEYDIRATGKYRTGYCCILFNIVTEISSPENDMCECFESNEKGW